MLRLMSCAHWAQACYALKVHVMRIEHIMCTNGAAMCTSCALRTECAHLARTLRAYHAHKAHHAPYAHNVHSVHKAASLLNAHEQLEAICAAYASSLRISHITAFGCYVAHA